MTSESTLSLDTLKFIDSLIAKYEGYLFILDDFQDIKPEQIVYDLPQELTQKYLKDDFTDYLSILNKIISEERLYDYLSYEQIPYVKKALTITKDLTLSKRIMVNRHILDRLYVEKLKVRKIKTISMYYITNGTYISEEFIKFTKGILFDSLCISLDGPKTINDKNRIYQNGSGTFSDIYHNIVKLQTLNIKTDISIVITPNNLNILEILEFLQSININQVYISFMRPKNKNECFDKESYKKIHIEIKKIYQKIYTEIKDNHYEILYFLSNTKFLSILRYLFLHSYVSSRCKWGNEIIIDSKGNLYHCNSTIGILKDKIANYTDKKNIKDIQKIYTTNYYKQCRNCWAKNLCGGPCRYEILLNNKAFLNFECNYQKNIIHEALVFYAKLQSLPNYKIIKNIILRGES